MVPGAGRGKRRAEEKRRAVQVRRISAQPIRRTDNGLLRQVFQSAGRRGRCQDRRESRPTAKKDERACARCTRWATTKPSPGWPPASSDSSCPTSSITSSSINRSPTIRRRATATNRSQQLAQIFENRRQYPQGRQSTGGSTFKEYGLREQLQRQAARSDRRQLGPVRTGDDAAGRSRGDASNFASATASKVSFEAHAIKVDKLLTDVKAYLKSNPRQLDWQKLNIGDLGYRLVQQNQSAVHRRAVSQLGPGA